MEIGDKLTQCSVGCAEWRSMQKERTASQDELKKLEDKLEKHADVGDAFCRQLQDVVPHKKDLFSGNVHAAVSKFQADTVIACRCLNGLSDLVLATDADLAALAGERCLAIADDFKFVGKKTGMQMLRCSVDAALQHPKLQKFLACSLLSLLRKHNSLRLTILDQRSER
jgi:hypothetical protein